MRFDRFSSATVLTCIGAKCRFAGEALFFCVALTFSSLSPASVSISLSEGCSALLSSEISFPVVGELVYSQKFSSSERHRLAEILTESLRHFRLEGSVEAMKYATDVERLKAAGLKLTLNPIPVTQFPGLNPKLMMEHVQRTEQSFFNADENLVKLTLFEFIEPAHPLSSDERKTLAALKNHIELQNFAVVMEELFHAAQFAFGSTLSEHYRMPVTAAMLPHYPGGIGQDPSLEWDMAFLFLELDLPRSPLFINEYYRLHMVENRWPEAAEKYKIPSNP